MTEFETFWERFVAVEQKNGLLDSRVAGFQLYALRRVKVFYALAVALGIYNDPHPGSGPKSAKPKPISLDFATVEEQPVVVVPFRRLVGGVDPYSETVIARLQEAGGTPTVWDWEWMRRIQDTARNQNRSSLLGKLGRKLSGPANEAAWQKIVGILELEFAVKLADLSLPKSLLFNYQSDVKVFADYFKAAKTKELYLVDAYSNQWLVLAAKQAGVKVIEIQHGFVNEFHPAYSYPKGSPSLDHSPDELLVWGKFWAEGVQFPKGMSATVSGPSRQFTRFRNSLASVKREPKQILFTSQGAVSEALSQAAIACAKAMPEYRVIYRLHPNEDLDSYPQENLPTNFSYSHKTPMFLELVAASEYLIGAFSTTLYEGLALGAKVLVLPLTGFENMNRAIAAGDVTVIKSIDAIREAVLSAKPAENADNYYAKENLND